MEAGKTLRGRELRRLQGNRWPTGLACSGPAMALERQGQSGSAEDRSETKFLATPCELHWPCALRLRPRRFVVSSSSACELVLLRMPRRGARGRGTPVAARSQRLHFALQVLLAGTVPFPLSNVLWLLDGMYPPDTWAQWQSSAWQKLLEHNAFFVIFPM